MKAAVIEDEMSHRMLLCEEIRKWGLDTKEPVTICEYDSAEAFLFDWEDQPSFDVLFIDIQMGQMDGVAMARKIREKDRNTALVFTTGVAEWMSVGYEVEALHYLLKPIDDKKLRECLERVREKRKTKQCLTFKGENGVYRFDERDIFMVEAQGHDCLLTVEEGQQWPVYRIRESMTEVSRRLPPDLFVKCHRSYLCSLLHIHHIEKTTLTLDNRQQVPVSRQMYAKVNDAFIHYYKSARESRL